MQLLRTLSVLVVFAGPVLSASVSAQKQKNPVNVNSLFADLPIDDAAGNSVLSKGESGVEKIKKNIFVVGSLNKSTCYSGESLLLTYQLYSALQSKSLVMEKPGLGNFNVEERPLNNEQPLLKKREGKDCRVFTIYQVQLNPFQPGNWTIDPLSVSNEVNYLLDGQTHSYSGVVTSNKILLNVLPLPAYTGTEAFSGAIGKYRFSAFVVSGRVAAGETDSLCLEIEGAGNLNAINMPAVKWPAGVETFPFKEKWVSVKNAFPPAGKKMVYIPFVAHTAGHFSIPSVRWSYFDPSLKVYKELESGAIDLTILPSVAGPEKKPAIPALPVVNSPDYSWILWLLGAFGISGLAFWLLRKKSHPYMGVAGEEIAITGGLAGREMGTASVELSGSRDAAGRPGDGLAGTRNTGLLVVGMAGPGGSGGFLGGGMAAGLQEGVDRDLVLAATARRALEDLRTIKDREQYVIQAKAILSEFLQESWPATGSSGDELTDSLYQHTQDAALAEDVRSFYARCSRLLYAPSDWAEVDVSLAGMIHLIIERCEIHKNINR